MKSDKLLLKNSIFNIIYKGFTALFPLLTTSYIARVLLPEGVGRVEYAMVIVSYFVTVASLGIPSYGIKAIAQSKESERVNVFLELFIINSISTLICLVAYYIFIFNVAYLHNRLQLFCVVGTIIFLNFFNIDWFYQGIEEYSYIAIRGIFIKTLSFILMLIFVKNAKDYIVYALILCIATAGNYILNIIQLRKFIHFENIEICNLKKHLLPILILFATTIATQIYTMLDSVMLEYIHGEAYVGYYSNAVKIVRMIYTVSIAMVAPLYPRISNYIQHKNTIKVNDTLSKGVKIILLLAIPAAVAVFLLSDWIVNILFGVAFMPSVITLKILSPLIVIFSFAYFLGHIVLMSLNKEKIILISTIIGACINVIFNLIFIPLFKHNGAAFSSLIAELIVTLYVIHASKHYYKITINIHFIYSMVISLLVMLLIIIGFKLIFSITIINMLILCLTAMVGYFVILYMLRNEEIFDLCNKILRK